MLKRIFYRIFSASYRVWQWGIRRLTPFGVLAFVAFVVFMTVGLDTRQTVAYQAGVLLAACLFLSMVFSLWWPARFEVERTLPEWCTKDAPFTYHLKVRNTSGKIQKGLFVLEIFTDPRPGLPLFLSAREPGESSRNFFDRAMGWHRWKWLLGQARGARVTRTPLPVLPAGGSALVALRMEPLHRGRLDLAGVLIGRPDPLGLAVSPLLFELPGSILSLPCRYPVKAPKLPGRRRYHSGGVALASSVGDSEEFISLREYRPGDPLRRISWTTWARTGTPVVRETQEEFFVRHALVLDTLEGGYSDAAFEEAVSVAASFAATVCTQESLLDLIFVGETAYCCTSGRGLAHLDKTMEILASVQPAREKPFQVLEGAVRERLGLFSGCICVLLAWDRPRRDFIAFLRGRGVPLLVAVITDKTPSPPLDPGPMADAPERFLTLVAGEIREIG